jgi:tetratricopeptide (TPR) repeat protein
VNLEKAIQSYQEALRIRTLESYPIDYATTQNNLGTAYADLALVRDKEENLEKAIQSYQEALRAFTEDRYPIDYSRTMRNLARARDAMGKDSDASTTQTEI